MNSGTQAAKEAGNMVDLDSNPTKLLEIVETGKALLMTRGSLTTFSIANDVAKYFAIIPAIFVSTYPAACCTQCHEAREPVLGDPVGGDLQRADHRGADSAGTQGACATAPSAPQHLLRRNLLIYGLGGLVVPFIGIKAIDLLLSAFGLV
jgi:K+-transporting ATPase ATPase B chain